MAEHDDVKPGSSPADPGEVLDAVLPEAVDDVKAAEEPSSPAPDDVDPAERLDLVTAALEGGSSSASKAEEPEKPEAEAEKAEEPEAKADDDDAKDAKTEGDPDDAEIEKYSQNAQKRIRGLIDEKKGLEAALAEQQQYREGVEQFSNWLQQSGVSGEEANQALDLARLVKSDPAQAYERLKPLYESLAAFVGQGPAENLPPDLRQEVEDGYLTEQRARELASLRTRSDFQAQRFEVEQQRHVQLAEQRNRDAMQATLDQWHAGKQSSDVDYATLLPMTQRYWAAELASGNGPATPAEAQQMAERIYAQVKADTKRLQPAPQPMQPIRAEVAASSTARREPQSGMDIVEAVLNGG